MDYLTIITLFDMNQDVLIKNKDSEEEILKKKKLEREFFKFPYICSEIISCNVYDINNTIVKDEELLLQFMSYLEKRKKFAEKQINTCHDTYFLRSASLFFRKYYFECACLILKHESIIHK